MVPKTRAKPYALIAPFYDFLDAYWEKRYQPIRKRLWNHVKGKRVLDAGAGTGRNMPFYPSEKEIIAIDTSKQMLAKARKRANEADANVTLKQMDLTKLSFSKNSFDTVVATFVLFVIPAEKEEQAVKEIKRVLKKGGRLCVLDYTLSQNPLRRFFQQLFAPLIYFLYKTRLDNQTYELAQKHFTIKKKEFVHADTLRMIIAEK